jgi:hypothetical protein
LIIVRSWLCRNFAWIYSLPRNAVLLAGPLIEIDQLASLGAEWPPLVIFPIDGLSASRTSRHENKSKKDGVKSKGDSGFAKRDSPRSGEVFMDASRSCLLGECQNRER